MFIRISIGRPYQNNVQHCPSESKLNKDSIEQRVLSAKMLRIKELQNQLADAHYRLNELANENKLLKALQKRQDSALKRYEGTNAELPRIINSHHEELRVLQIKYKKLKTLQKETCDLLKEKENELQQLQSQNKHLLQLSKDRNLGEREKLQLEVSDLNHRIQKQQDTIQTLHKKLTLETKSLKQQLHLEISKRKETQKHLDEITEKLKTLENLLDNKERRLYCNQQLLFPDKSRRFGTRSLTNLRDISSSNPLKISEKSKKWQADVQKNSLPILHTSESNDKNIKTDERINSNQVLDYVKSETMTNLEQVRKYRLQKSPCKSVLNNSEEKSKDLEFVINENSEIIIDLENSEQLKKHERKTQKYQINTNKLKEIYNNRNCQNFNKLLEKNLTYSSEDSESENENENNKDNYANETNNSKQLHSRLINNTNETSDLKELKFSDCNINKNKYKDKLKILVKERTNSYESDSEIESEIKKQSIEHYLTMNQNDTLKLISSMYNNETHCDLNKNIEKCSSPSPKSILNESQNLYQHLIDEMHVQTKTMENETIYAQCNVKNIQTEYKHSENLENFMFEQAVSKIQEYNNINITKDDFENESLSYAEDEYNKLFKTNSLESIDDKSEISHTNEIIFNDSQKISMKDALNSSKNLNKEIINRIDPTEIEMKTKNIFLQNYKKQKNKLDKQETENIDIVSYNVKSFNNDIVHDMLNDVSIKNDNNIKTKITDYNKEKLLASMKAIDNNENIEFLNQDYEKHNTTAKRKQITEDVFHNLHDTSHMKKKQDIIKDIFDTDVIKNESTDSFNKLH